MNLVMIFLAFLAIVLLFTKPWIYFRAEDRQVFIQTEIRLRKSGKQRLTSLSHYTFEELMAFEKELRDIKSKRKLGYPLLPQEKALINRFPFSYRIIRKSNKKKG